MIAIYHRGKRLFRSGNEEEVMRMVLQYSHWFSPLEVRRDR